MFINDAYILQGMAETTVARRKPLVTAKSTMIDQILKGLRDLERILNKDYNRQLGGVMVLRKSKDADPEQLKILEGRLQEYSENLDNYSDTIKTLKLENIRRTSPELSRISGILKTVKRWTNNSDVIVLANYLIQLIDATNLQFKIKETTYVKKQDI
jgi:hypothetical protein